MFLRPLSFDVFSRRLSRLTFPTATALVISSLVGNAFARDDSGQHAFFESAPTERAAPAPHLRSTMGWGEPPALTIRRTPPIRVAEGHGWKRGRDPVRFAERNAPRRHHADRRLELARDPRIAPVPTVPRMARVAPPAAVAAADDLFPPMPPPRPPDSQLLSPIVAIFEDRTLRRGDAVMLDEGLRVFAGAAHFPYRLSDFVRIEHSPIASVKERYILTEIALTFDKHSWRETI